MATTPNTGMWALQDYDGAEPAPTSIAISNLLRLGAMSAPEKAEPLRERASQAAAAFQARLQEAPLAVPQMCCSLSLLAGNNPLPHPGRA
jgi:uncharacterized protein YyaL (SSP411 family)